MGKKDKKYKFPFVSICTPTFNRRPFIPIMIKCFEHQTYPKDKIEWIIVDDGTDKIEELVSHVPQIKYFKYDEKMTLGKKRNILNEKSKGDIIIYMDDDDYYPPDRISHAVEMLLKSPKALCAGSSAMFIYFKHINKMFQFGPYNPNHATAATFAFKRELLKRTKFDEKSSVAEEKKFLNDYTIPFVQLDPKKSIVVFSHNHNSFDKKELLKQLPNPNIHETELTPADLVNEPEILNFFMNDINILLETYDPGKPEHKPDVTKQLEEIKKQREEMIKEQLIYHDNMNKINMLMNPQLLENKNNELTILVQQLTYENSQLKQTISYLENKLKQIISDKISEKMKEKEKEKDVKEANEQILQLSQDKPIVNVIE
jgi:glycosyltransferase involved in cell wall biosynthesis